MAGNIEGLSIGLDLDSVKVEQGFSKLKRDMKTMNAEMKKNMSAFDRADDSLEKYEASLAGVQKKLKLQEKTTEAARREMVKMSDQHGEGSAKAQKATREYNEQVASLKNLERYTENATDEIEKMRQKQKQANSVFGKASTKLNNFSERTDNAANKLGSAGKKMTVGVTAPLAGIGAMAVKTGMDFEKAMSEVQAVSGASAEDMEKLENKARKMGSTTQFSATESAQALKFMGLAGWSAQESMTGLDGVMDLAAASGEDLGSVSDIVTDSISAFGLEAKDAGMFADVLASASSNANTTVAGMGKAFEYVAPVAGSLNFSIQDTATAIGLMADNGIKGEKAGTALRSMMTNLAKPTGAMKEEMKRLGISLTNSEGEMKSFDTIMGDLRTSFADLDEKQKANAAATLFGKEAMSGALSIINTTDESYDSLSGSINGSEGAAKKMADTVNDNAKGSLKEMQSALEELSIVASEHLLPPLTDIIEKATSMARKFGKLPDSTQKTILVVGGLAAALGPLSLAFGGVFKGVSLFTRGLGKVTGGLSKLGRGAKGSRKSLNSLASSTTRAGGAASKSSGKLGRIAGSIFNIGKGARGSKKNLSSFSSTATKAGGTAAKNAGKFGKVAGSISRVGKFAGVARLGLGALGGPMGILATIAIPQLVKGGAKLVNHLRKDSIPAVDGFGKKVDKTTTEAVLGYKKLNDDATIELTKLFGSGEKITKEGSEKLRGLFSKMGTSIRDSLDKKFEESKSSISTLMDQTTAISKKGEQSILDNMQKSHTEQKEKVQKKENRIKEIMNKASQEKRQLTKSEKDEINKLQRQMRNTAVQTMSDSEAEQTAIMDKLRQKAGDISARQAAKTVKESKKAKNGSVKEAKEKYDEVVRSIVRERDETGSISEDEADQLISAAKEQRDESISQAVKKHKGVVKQAKKQAKGQIENVDWATGSVLSGWDKMVRGAAQAVNWVSKGINWVLDKINVGSKIPMWEPSGYNSIAGSSHKGPGGPARHYAKGTSSSGHKGGPAIVGEKGPELGFIPGKGTTLLGARGPEFHRDLPRGSAVLPNKETEQTLKNFGFPGYENGIGDFFQNAFNAPKKMLQGLWNRFKPSLPSFGGKFGDMFGGVVKLLKDKAGSYVKDKVKGFFGGGAGGTSGGGRINAGLTKTSSFGMRFHPIQKRWKLHGGDDYGGPMGTPIPAQTGGRVSYAGWGGGFGNLVKVATGAFEHFYAHLNSIAVRTGQMIKRGSIVGGLGTTGNSTGPHLHYEVRKNGRAIRPTASYATGGLIKKRGMYELAEEGHPEYVIPTDPKRRTEAMKLLALAGKDINRTGSRNKRPSELRGANVKQPDNRTNEIIEKLSEQVDLLTQLVLKDNNVYLDGRSVGRQLEPSITEFQNRNRERRS